jgi:hypothetical protein
MPSACLMPPVVRGVRRPRSARGAPDSSGRRLPWRSLAARIVLWHKNDQGHDKLAQLVTTLAT